MKKLNLFAVMCMIAAFSFAQNAGQWSFGAGGNFVAPGAEDDNFKANIGYFAIDGVMMSFDFGMNMEYENTVYTDVITGTDEETGEDIIETLETSETVEGDFEWGLGLRWYPKDNLFLEGTMATGTGEDPDITMGAGVSLELAFDGRLWFEPMIKFDMPGEEEGPLSQRSLGLAWQFRYTF